MCNYSRSHFQCMFSRICAGGMCESTNKFKILVVSDFWMLVSRGGKKVIILLQKLELELVISDCNVLNYKCEMIETRTRCVAISGGGKICYRLFGLLQRPFGQR